MKGMSATTGALDGLGVTVLQRLSISELAEPSIITKSKANPRLPFKVNSPIATPTRPPPEMRIKTMQEMPTVALQAKSPWDTYKTLGILQRGDEVRAAYTRTEPIKLVAIQKISSDNFKQFRSCRYKNLLAILEAYRFEGDIFAITDYIATSLRHIIASRRELEELHVSVTCYQGSLLLYTNNHLTNVIIGIYRNAVLVLIWHCCDRGDPICVDS